MSFTDEKGIISKEMLAIIENTNDLMFLKNRESVYIAASKSFAEKCIKCDCVEDIIGKTDFEIFEDPSIAARYRADDEQIFTSGTNMIDFQEELIDNDGKKHLCLTTKYLIHDRDGKAIAILGQYHDIGQQLENEISRHRDINRHVVSALSSSFFISNYVDLRTHKYTLLHAKDYVRKMIANCNTNEEGFETFIHTLVRADFQDKMRAFCDMDTICQRINGKTQIDCEYLSTVAKGWCRASFFPGEYDETGEVTHILFTVSAIDDNKAKELEENILNKKSIEAIFDKVPGGIVMYKWDGVQLTTLRISEYYANQYGTNVSLQGDHSKDANFMRIHPEDIAEYHRVIKEDLIQNHNVEHVIRVWNHKKSCYVWTQVNAISEQQPDGTYYIYAMYTDVSGQKDAEKELQKSHKSMVSALGASNQLCYEYDPIAHTGDCYTDTNFFDLPKHIENYPDSLREIDLFHPDDAELFIRTAHQMDAGQERTQCDVRIKKHGKYCWYACMFDAYYDTEKGYHVAILSVVDISLRMASIQDYEERLQTMLSQKENVLSICSINLTQNTFKMVGMDHSMENFVNEEESFETVMLSVVDNIIGEDSKKAYIETFRRDSLLKQAQEGNTHIQLEYLLKLSNDHYEWVTAVVDLVRNPVSGEIGGIAYSKSSQIPHMSNELLIHTMQQDYLFSAFVFIDTDEFYLYYSKEGKFSERKTNFWEVALKASHPRCSQEALKYLRFAFCKDKMLPYLEENKEFSYAYDSNYTGTQGRLEIKFRYLDKEHTMLLVTLRDITDIRLLEKWHFESEHDSLTGLLNRKTVFHKCRKLLQEYPDEQFIMLHCDIRHFHLYNTFFGERAGDLLLCKIAKLISDMGKDYEYWAYGRIESDVFCAFFPIKQEVFDVQTHYFFAELASYSEDFPLEPAIGCYWVTDPQMSIEEMFSRATIAAKSGERNLFGLISSYDDHMDQSLRDTQQITSEMHAAIAKEQFEVYLQPKYSLRSEKLIGAEALVRWKHPERGMVSPGKFIPIFEKNGFITELDRYMWEHVCQLLQKWSNEGKPMYPVSVNMSRVSMYSHATVPFLKALVKKYHIDPQYLELELTESAYMDDPEELKCMLKDLQNYGFKILMDDFGSGYSSLNTLRELPVDILKLDMKFLSESQNDHRGKAVLTSVIRMSKLLNLPIVAEGVEKREQAIYLRSTGCEYVQGYLFAKPMPVSDYEKLLIPQSTITESPMAPPIGHIIKMIGANDSLGDAISEAFPSPLAFIEFEKDRMVVLRANNKFMEQFGLIKDERPASGILKEKMDVNNYQILMDSLEKCVRTQKPVVFHIAWPGIDGETKLLGCVDYVGSMDEVSHMIIEFVDMTQITL